MSILLYMDVHVPRSITRSLVEAGADILTAQDDGCGRMSDPELLDPASSLNRVLFTRDDDLLSEATRRQRVGVPFGGLIYGHQMRVTIGQCVRDLLLIAQCGFAHEMANNVVHLPLK